MKTSPRLYLGTMTFAWSQSSSKIDKAIAQKMIECFRDQSPNSNVYIDTARIYAAGNTEVCLKDALAELQQDASSNSFLIGTKAHPSQPGGLSKTGIERQFAASCNALAMDSFEEYYLHQPDPEHSLLESLQILDQYKREGKIKVIGMSNYHADEMERAFELCARHNLAPPTVYQGLYNPLNRAVEDSLLHVLHKHDCQFIAYNPLAAGLLSGKHTSLNSVQKGRFCNNPNYLPRFYTKANFEALAILQAACHKTNIKLLEATYRWLLCHSALQSTDGVLLGASSLDQLQQNLDACQRAQTDPLPDELLTAFDTAWAITQRNGAFPYWRSYSGDMPNREKLDPGASYQANKK